MYLVRKNINYRIFNAKDGTIQQISLKNNININKLIESIINKKYENEHINVLRIEYINKKIYQGFLTFKGNIKKNDLQTGNYKLLDNNEKIDKYIIHSNIVLSNTYNRLSPLIRHEIDRKFINLNILKKLK